MLVRFTLSDDDLGQNLFRNVYYIHDIMIIFVYLAILCALFGMVKWPLQRLSDLQLGDQKAILNHLVFKYIYIDTWFSSILFYSHINTYGYCAYCLGHIWNLSSLVPCWVPRWNWLAKGVDDGKDMCPTSGMRDLFSNIELLWLILHSLIV